MEKINTKKFIGLTNDKSDIKKCRFIVVPIPYEKTTSYGHGTKFGPKKIIEASSQIELWDEETKKENWLKGIYTSSPIKCSGSENSVFKNIEKVAKKYCDLKNKIPFFIGGEHSITQALTKPFINKHKNISILHFDAHADLRRSYEGFSKSHACALYPASLKCKIVQVGIRSVSEDEALKINKKNVKTFLMHENRDVKKLIPKVLKSLTNTVYITIDVDGFDPSVIPATGTPQPGGFMWYEALDLFKAVCTKKSVVGVDIVEVAPRKFDTLSEFNTAKLIYRLMSYLS